MGEIWYQNIKRIEIKTAYSYVQNYLIFLIPSLAKNYFDAFDFSGPFEIQITMPIIDFLNVLKQYKINRNIKFSHF